MNGNQLFPGSDYAYTRWPQRKPGVYYSDATRVRVIRVLSVEIRGQTKRRNYVEVEFLNRDGTHREPQHFTTVRGAQLVYHWKEHAEMLERREAEQRKREESYRLQREEQQRRYQEQLLATKVVEESIYKLFENMGIQRQYVEVGTYHVRVNRSILQGVINEQQNTIQGRGC